MRETYNWTSNTVPKVEDWAQGRIITHEASLPARTWTSWPAGWRSVLFLWVHVACHSWTGEHNWFVLSRTSMSMHVHLCWTELASHPQQPSCSLNQCLILCHWVMQLCSCRNAWRHEISPMMQVILTVLFSGICYPENKQENQPPLVLYRTVEKLMYNQKLVYHR